MPRVETISTLKKILRQYSTKTNVVREKNAENKKRINLVVKNVLKL